MENSKKSTRLAGILYLTAFIAGILSIARAVDDTAYLTRAAAESDQTTLAAFFQFALTMAYLGVAVILYPILKRVYHQLALGFLSFSIAGAICNIIGIILMLLILSLSQAYIKTVNPDTALFELIGGLLHTGRDLINHVAMIVMQSTGGIMLYMLLFKTQLIPKWLSMWGIIGSVLAITASFTVMFNRIDILTPAYMLVNVPLVLQQLIFALWLIVRGFDKERSLNPVLP